MIPEPSRDPLTGLLAKREWPAAVARSSGSWVALLDIDHMKRFNMHNGHQKGDEVLARLGKHLLAGPPGSTRDALRVGGQTFAIVWPTTNGDSDMAGAHTEAETLRAWAESTLTPPQAYHCGDAHCMGPTNLTLSIALTTVVDNEEPSSLMDRLEGAMTDAKKAGRNRVVVVAILNDRRASENI